MPELFLMVPGDPETVTGGYAYDRALVAALRRRGWSARLIPLPADFPESAHDSIDSAFDSIASVPADGVVLVDGLAFGALPAERLQALRRPVAVLVHHPLALEGGLCRADAGAADDGDWTVITRDDGSKQWAYKGKPLYTYRVDAPGKPASGVGPAWPLAVK
jgi:hypothetical protein